MLPISHRHYNRIFTIGMGDMDAQDIIDLEPRELDDLKKDRTHAPTAD